MDFKVALLQFDYLVGDIAGNTKKIIKGYDDAVSKGAQLVVATELALFGYPPKDLLLLPDKIAQQEASLSELAFHVGPVPLIVGIATGNGSDFGMPLHNSAIVLRNKATIGMHHKMLLPNYDVFDERRYFEPGTKTPHVIDIDGVKIGLLICEDIWGGAEVEHRKLYSMDPVKFFERQSMDLLVVINASPYHWGKGTVRFNLVSGLAKRLHASVVYANQVGGNDELIFDGRSFMVNAAGECITAAAPFQEEILIENAFPPFSIAYPFDHDRIDDLYDALVVGLRDYLRKIGNNKVVIGISGGIDSAVTACLAVEAVGPGNVLGILMPSAISSRDSVEDAELLAKRLGIRYHIVPIVKPYDALGETLRRLGFSWYEPHDALFDVTQENVQARLRGVTLMSYSNREGRIVLSTGNKSEVAVGFCTLYGDMCGGLAVLSDVPKTLVYRLARYINTRGGFIPDHTIEKKPSADLRPNQVDEDALPPYDVLDRIIHLFVEEHASFETILEEIGDAGTIEKVLKMIRLNEFKRQQMPPGLKVTSKAFGVGRRFPIAAR